MGWQYKDLEISYIEYPSVEVLDKDGRPVKIDIVHSRSEAFYRSKKPNQDAVVVTFTKQGCSRSIFPYFAEAYVSELLPPDEFRKHCDKHKTAEAIIHALK